MFSQSKEIGLGVIGLGMGSAAFVAHEHADLCSFRVRAVCDINEDRLKKTVEAHHVPIATTDWRELVCRPEVDAVGVYSPDALHAEHVLGALEAGKPVLVTKPFTTCLSDAKRILGECRRRGLPLLVGQTCRFIRDYQIARRLAREGRYGRVLYVEATYNHDLCDTFEATPWRYRMPQDFLFGGLCHPMDLALWVGGRPRRVSAFCHEARRDERYPHGVPDNYVVNVEFTSEALGRVIGLYSFVHADGIPYISLTIAGTLAGSCQEQVTWQPVGGHRKVDPLAQHAGPAETSERGRGHLGEVLKYLVHFEDCLRNGGHPSPGVLEATRLISALEATRQSARSGRAEEVEWDF
ncbi:MAG: Gfo/Idh/MocA family oxidoreductase [Planctomycetes bacterium]|nr:Gfo/Idh/MocA family oxidoreductase [Planctomycetota bacterium]